MADEAGTVQEVEAAPEPLAEPEDVDGLSEPEDMESSPTAVEEAEPAAEGEAGDEETAAGEEKPEAEGVTVDPALLARAQEFGISSAHAQKLGEAGLLQEELMEEMRRTADWNKQQLAQAQTPQQAAPVAAPQAPAALSVKLDPEEHGEDVVKAFGALQDYANQQTQRVSNIENVLGQFIQRQAKAEGQAAVQRFETLIAGVADEWGDVLGKGKGSELKPDGPEMGNRLKVSDAMDRLGQVYAESEPELFQRALKMEFADVTAKRARQKISGQVKKRGALITSPATQRAPETGQTADQMSRRRISRVMEEKGMKDEDKGVLTEDEDQFPE